MIFLLTLLSLLAAECRVHRSDSTWCWVKPPKDSCIVNSHWVDTCAMRDSIMAEHRDSNDPNNLPCPKGYHGIRVGSFVIDTDPPTYCYHCYPDTAESHNGLVTWFGVAPSPPPDSYLSRSYPAPLDSAELSDIREMLREWPKLIRRIAYYDCLDTLKLPPDTLCFLGNMDTTAVFVRRATNYPTVRDSCRCLYERKEK